MINTAARLVRAHLDFCQGRTGVKKNYREYTVSGAPPLSFSPVPFPPFPSALNPARGLGSAVSSPAGSGAEPRPQTHFSHIWSLENASGDNNFTSCFTSHYPSGGLINFLKQGPTGKSPGFPAGQSAPE